MDYYKYDQEFKTREISERLPYLKFDNDWEVKVGTPFFGASARFMVRKCCAEVSVYADFFDNCGYVGKPYWEVYPYDNDVFRCLIHETDSLLDAIRKSIEMQENK
jgi:hypothetical protein